MQQTPEYFQCEDGSIRICIGEFCGTVSSWHLVAPKVNQLKELLDAKNKIPFTQGND